MIINRKFEEKTLILSPEGRIDTVTAPIFEKELGECLQDAETLVLDFSNVSYMSSAGLRVLLKTQKILSQKGGMKLTGVNETILEVLEITGFIDILIIE